MTVIAAGCFGNTAIINDDSHWQDSVLYISNYLIASMSARTGILTVADSTLGIANDALDYCHINKCVLPEGLHFIGDMAFKDCTLLDTVCMLGTMPPTITSGSFNGCTALSAVVVPCSSATAYNNAQYWNQLNIVEDTCPTPHVSIATAQENNVTATVSRGILTVNGANGQPIIVSDITGRRISSIASANNTSVVLPSTGIYIVSVGSSAPLKICYLK